jgi:uncharacterized protein YndB with AHSA1/START domain
MSEHPDPGSLALRIERTFDASVQAVFDAWTNVDVLRRWWHAEHDWETPHAEVDLRVGGGIRLVMRNPVNGAEYGGQGEFTVVSPPTQLAFTWSWDDVPGRQLIEVEFTGHGSATTVVMTHHGIAEAARGEYLEGWQDSFDNLDRALAG